MAAAEQNGDATVLRKQRDFNLRMKDYLHHSDRETVAMHLNGQAGVCKSSCGINRSINAANPDSRYQDSEEFNLESPAPEANGDQHCTKGMIKYGTDEECYDGEELGDKLTICDHKGWEDNLDQAEVRRRLPQYFSSFVEGYVVDEATKKVASLHDSEREKEDWWRQQDALGKRLPIDKRPHIVVFVATADAENATQWDLFKAFDAWRNNNGPPFIPSTILLTGVDKVDESLWEKPWLAATSAEVQSFLDDTCEEQHNIDKRLVYPVIGDLIFGRSDISHDDDRLIGLDYLSLRFLKRSHELATKYRSNLIKKERRQRQAAANREGHEGRNQRPGGNGSSGHYRDLHGEQKDNSGHA